MSQFQLLVLQRQRGIGVVCHCENVLDNVVNNMANRTTVNHRAAIPPAVVTQQQQRSAPPPVSSVRAEVAFKRLPFYDVLADVMKPSSLGVSRRVSFGKTAYF